MNASHGLLTDRLADVGQVIIRHPLTKQQDSLAQPPCQIRLTAPTFTTGMLVELLVCLDQLGFVMEEADK